METAFHPIMLANGLVTYNNKVRPNKINITVREKHAMSVCGDKSPPSLPRPSFLFHLLISVLNTSDGLGGSMTHSGCSSSL